MHLNLCFATENAQRGELVAEEARVGQVLDVRGPEAGSGGLDPKGAEVIVAACATQSLAVSTAIAARPMRAAWWVPFPGSSPLNVVAGDRIASPCRRDELPRSAMHRRKTRAVAHSLPRSPLSREARSRRR